MMNDLMAWFEIIPKVEKTGDFKPLLEALRTGKPSIVPYAAHWLANLLDPDLPLAQRNK
jgi:hypothetical protein